MFDTIAQYNSHGAAIRAAKRIKGPQIKEVKALKDNTLSIHWKKGKVTKVTHGLIDMLAGNK